MAPTKKPKHRLDATYLASWREHLGLTQDEAAEKIGVSRSLLSKMETADSPYTQRTLEAAARAYGCAPFELLARDPADTAGRGQLIHLLCELPQSQYDYIRGALEAAVSLGRKAGE